MTCTEYLNEGGWLGHTYYTPEVTVSILKPDGSGQVNWIIEVDSGAAITLLPRGAATMLGLVLESGIPVSLGGVGGSSFICYVHRLDVVIGDAQFNGLPIAFAPTDDFPPLLGRLGLYDVLDVLMDNAIHATCIGTIGEPLPPPSGTLWPWPILDPSLLIGLLVVGGLLAVVMLVR